MERAKIVKREKKVKMRFMIIEGVCRKRIDTELIYMRLLFALVGPPACCMLTLGHMGIRFDHPIPLNADSYKFHNRTDGQLMLLIIKVR